ncbi:DNA polymerase III alpha [Rhodococcus phage Weasels2]|uniref:DNA-directed DNA polymerase n=1 Tax=Rhodococcus phage Weasels2 TaxID=1897437 RepID=A0A1I9SA85_9CAUD|nr:DNA polymerase [Rhodococcus phage Weasels2]AOZ63691.1 DNA polymerase III alpha [Rhodococcus phage Weasels2]
MAKVKQAYTLYKNLETLPEPEGKDIEGLLREICKRGMTKRKLDGKQEYEDQLEEELELILRKKFGVYFIILWDILRYARREGIPIGAGRGSAAGSLVCYVMEITEVDPLEHNLLFWRFLSEERDGYPDVDVDIAHRYRSKLKRYVEDKYGSENVASITTFSYYSAKSAIKAACRIMKVPFSESNALVKNIETMDDFRKERYREFHTKYPEVYKIAKGLEGMIEKAGYHAAATIITKQKLTDLTSIESRAVKGEEFRQPTIALTKDDAEELGFIKYDFLGLVNLTVVDDCVKMIRKNYGRIIDPLKIRPDDDKVFKMISDGHTLGVFQAEASASTKVIKEMGIENFGDLVASNALVRPGAWKAFGKDYIARKKGYKKVTFPTPESEEYLKDTYGFYLFQEQTMLICTDIAGLSKTDADKIRKLTAHKEDPITLAPFKEAFLNGARKKVSQEQAEKLWADIELTAEYSFNKCLAEDTLVDIMIDDDESDELSYETCTLEQVYNLFSDFGSSVDFYVKGPEFINGIKVGPDTWHLIKGVHNNGVKDVWRVWTDSETYIDATATHRHRLSKNWKIAAHIHQNDEIWTDTGKKTVAGKRYAGMVQTYDLELADEPHAFYANGFLTHNSHSVAYSDLSYTTAYLKYYYPAEFMTALLNNEEDNNSISNYLSECKRLGITVKTPDVNKSGIGYTTDGTTIYIGLANIKYISDKLAERVIDMRPFTSYKDMCDRMMTKGSGLTTRVIDSLNKVGATDFKDHKVNHDDCKEFWYEYLGIASFDSAIITDEMWTRITRLEDFEDRATGIVVGFVQDIKQKGWIRIDITDGTGQTGFFVDEDHGLEKGKRYLFAIANNSMLKAINLEDKTPNVITEYLQGYMDDNTWIIAAKSRTTKNGKLMGTMIYSIRGELRSCSIFESEMMMMKGKFGPGAKVRIALNSSPKWGDSLKKIIRDER